MHDVSKIPFNMRPTFEAILKTADPKSKVSRVTIQQLSLMLHRSMSAIENDIRLLKSMGFVFRDAGRTGLRIGEAIEEANEMVVASEDVKATPTSHLRGGSVERMFMQVASEVMTPDHFVSIMQEALRRAEVELG